MDEMQYFIDRLSRTVIERDRYRRQLDSCRATLAEWRHLATQQHIELVDLRRQLADRFPPEI